MRQGDANRRASGFYRGGSQSRPIVGQLFRGGGVARRAVVWGESSAGAITGSLVMWSPWVAAGSVAGTMGMNDMATGLDVASLTVPEWQSRGDSLLWW